MATADDRRLLELAAEPAGELFPMLKRAAAFRPLLVLFAVLPGLYALTQRTLTDTAAWWSLASIELATADTSDLAGTDWQGSSTETAAVWRPPLSVWLTALVMRRFDPDEGITTVLISYLATIALIVLAYHVFGRLGDARLGLWTAVLLAFHGLVLSQAQTPAPISLGTVLALGTIWGFYAHVRTATAPVSIPLLLGGVAGGLCLLAAGPLAIGVLLVLIGSGLAIPPRRPAARVVPHPAAIRRRTSWPTTVPLAALTLTSFAVGGWWPLMVFWNSGVPDSPAWLTFGRLEMAAGPSAGSLEFWLRLFDAARETVGAVGGFVLLGAWRAGQAAFGPDVDARKSGEGASPAWLRVLLVWTGVALVALGAVMWTVPASAEATAAWQAFLVLPAMGLAAYAADEIARRRIGVFTTLSAAIVSLALAVDSAAWQELFVDATDPALLGAALLVAGSLFVTIVWRMCRRDDDRQQLVLTLVILAHVIGNAALGMSMIHRQTEDDRALLAFRRELSAAEIVTSDTAARTRWTLISDLEPPLPLVYILRSEWPDGSPRPEGESGVVETWDAALAGALNEPAGSDRRYIVVEWSSRDTQPTNIQVPGLQVVPLGRPQFYRDRQLRAFQVTRTEA